MVSGSDPGRTFGALCLLGANVELPAVVLRLGCVDGVRASRLAALGVQRLEDRRALANGVVLLALLLNPSHPEHRKSMYCLFGGHPSAKRQQLCADSFSWSEQR